MSCCSIRLSPLAWQFSFLTVPFALSLHLFSSFLLRHMEASVSGVTSSSPVEGTVTLHDSSRFVKASRPNITFPYVCCSLLSARVFDCFFWSSGRPQSVNVRTTKIPLCHTRMVYRCLTRHVNTYGHSQFCMIAGGRKCPSNAVCGQAHCFPTNLYGYVWTHLCATYALL